MNFHFAVILILACIGAILFSLVMILEEIAKKLNSISISLCNISFYKSISYSKTDDK